MPVPVRRNRDDRTEASRTGTILVGRRRHRRGGHRRRCRSRAAPGSAGVRRLGLRHRRGARRLRRGRARHRDQSEAAASAVPGGLTLDDFAIDEQAGTVTCPGGHTRTMSPKRTVTFGAVFADCPLRARCTTAKDWPSMSVHEHEALLRAARAQARTPSSNRPTPPARPSSESSAGPPPAQDGGSSCATWAWKRTTPG